MKVYEGATTWDARLNAVFFGKVLELSWWSLRVERQRTMEDAEGDRDPGTIATVADPEEAPAGTAEDKGGAGRMGSIAPE